jgi:FkbM family methyltransferase
VLPNGHWYKLVILKHKNFNIPIFNCYNLIFKHINPNPTILDVGSAVGDTVLYLEEKIKNYRLNSSPKYICVDGDPVYCRIAEQNLKHIKNRVLFFQTLISNERTLIPEVIKEDPTTGSSIGTKKAECTTLDIIWETINKEKIDLIKVDIDGYDSKALIGGKDLIKTWKPIIIFEWNVPLFEKTGNDPYEIFPFLSHNLYSNLVWYTNTGLFAFITSEINEKTIKNMIEYQELRKDIDGSHYDIIAFPDDKKSMLPTLFN